MSELTTFTCSDEKVLSLRKWVPENKNQVAVVQILHGMAEHSARYERFATYLNSKGFIVYAHDHRGHGFSTSDDERGWFAERDGWMRVAQDSYEISTHIAKEHPNKQLFLLGHSMGSFLARTLMVLQPELYQGVILSGTAAGKGLLGKIGKLLASSRAKRHGSRTPDALLDKMSFGSFSKKFEPHITNFDWLSRDTEEVQKYVDDPHCGFVCSSQFFVDLITGIEFANNRTQMARVPKDLPLLLVSGDEDPVGDFGKGVTKVYRAYLAAGLTDVTLHLIPGGRHELLNETTREEIFTLIGSWLISHL